MQVSLCSQDCKSYKMRTFIVLVFLPLLLELVSAEFGSVRFSDKTCSNIRQCQNVRGRIIISVRRKIRGGWKVSLKFDKPVLIFAVRGARITSRASTEYILANKRWNKNLKAASTLVITFQAKRFPYTRHLTSTAILIRRKKPRQKTCVSITTPKGFHGKMADVTIFKNWHDARAFKARVSVTTWFQANQWEIHLKFSKRVTYFRVSKAKSTRVSKNYFILRKGPWASKSLGRGQKLEIEFMAYGSAGLPCITALFAWRGKFPSFSSTRHTAVKSAAGILSSPKTTFLTKSSTSLTILSQNCGPTTPVSGKWQHQVAEINLEHESQQRFKAKLTVRVPVSVTDGWQIILTFSKDIKNLRTWRAQSQKKSGRRFVLTNMSWNKHLKREETLEMVFFATKTGKTPQVCAQLIWKVKPKPTIKLQTTIRPSIYRPTTFSFRSSTDEIPTPRPSKDETTTPSKSSTDETTTPGPSTDETTTPRSSADETTTPGSSTDETTTPGSSTDETTTPRSSVDETTRTPQTSTDKTTTHRSSKDETTTLKSSINETTTPRSSADETIRTPTDKTTTHLPSTDKTTISRSSTSEITTHQSSTDETTIPISSTDETTTLRPSTDKTTSLLFPTNKTTTPRSSTDETMTSRLSTDGTRTRQSSTEKTASPRRSSTYKTTTPPPSTDERTTPRPPTDKTTTPKSSTHETTPKLSTNKTITPRLSKDGTTTPRSSTDETTTHRISTDKTTTSRPSTYKMSTSRSSTDERRTPKLSTDKTTSPRLSKDETTTAQSSTDEITTPRSSTDETETLRTTTVRLSTDETTTQPPSDGRTTPSIPSTDKRSIEIFSTTHYVARKKS